jgi:putative transposase
LICQSGILNVDSFFPCRARIDSTGALHHVIGRGIERRKIFWGDCDRDDFSERLETIVRENQTAV